MSWFWIALGALTCAATASLVLPLLLGGRSRASAPAPSDEARRVAVYRDRRAEIEAEREAGRLTEDEARRATDELIEDAARQIPTQEPARDPDRAGRGRAIAIAVVSAIAIPLVSVLVYASLGTPSVVGLDTASMREELSPQALRKAIDELRAAVRETPQDAQAWETLGQAEQLAGDHARSAEAFGRAVALSPGNARLLADYAEAQMMAQGGDFSGKPLELLEQALAIDPADTKSIAMMGAAQYRLGNRAKALQYMRELASSMQPGSHEAQRLAEFISSIEAEIAAGAGAGSPVAPGAGSGPQARAGAGNAPAQPAKGPDAPAQPAAAPSGASAIVGSITIDDALRAQARPGATLFVVARGTDGSRVPLAALRLGVGSWPVPFEIGDAQAMDASRTISAAKGVIIEARVSQSGAAGRQSGDLFGVTPALRPGTRDVVVRIDQRVP